MKRTLSLCLFICSTVKALGPAPEPNDYPFPCNPGLCDPNYPPFAWCEAETGVSQVFRFWVCSEHDSHLGPSEETNVYLTMKDANDVTIPIGWLRETKFASGSIWVQTIQILWTPTTEGVQYYKLEAKDQQGVYGRWTLICNVTTPYTPPQLYFYPIKGTPPIAQQLWQRAKKERVVATYPTHVW